jgi:hypothetical protein
VDRVEPELQDRDMLVAGVLAQALAQTLLEVEVEVRELWVKLLLQTGSQILHLLAELVGNRPLLEL